MTDFLPLGSDPVMREPSVASEQAGEVERCGGWGGVGGVGGWGGESPPTHFQSMVARGGSDLPG